MIYYETGEWIGLIFRYRGTIWQRVWWRWMLISLYILGAYLMCKNAESDLGKTKSNILGSTLSFLLVFRANAGYQRFWEGRTRLTRLFCDLRELVALALVCLPGGHGYQKLRWRRRFGFSPHVDVTFDHQDNVICQERVNVIRWSLVLAISVQLHTRILEDGLTHSSMDRETKWTIDWDRYRIRHLTNEEEFKNLDNYVRNLVVPRGAWPTPDLDASLTPGHGLWDGPCPDEGPENYDVSPVPAMRMPVVALMQLNQVLNRCISDPKNASSTGGMPERFASVFIGFSTKILQAYTDISQVIATPLPFPYFHLCKTLLFVQFLAFPFFIEYKLGFWANVVEPSMLTLALLGVDAIAIELENPYGSDDNDLDIYEKIANFEEELMFFLDIAGDKVCKENFQWLDIPKELTNNCVSPITRFLALRSMVKHDGKSESTTVNLGSPTEQKARPQDKRKGRHNKRHERTLEDEASDYSDDDDSS